LTKFKADCESERVFVKVRRTEFDPTIRLLCLTQRNQSWSS